MTNKDELLAELDDLRDQVDAIAEMVKAADVSPADKHQSVKDQLNHGDFVDVVIEETANTRHEDPISRTENGIVVFLTKDRVDGHELQDGDRLQARITTTADRHARAVPTFVYG